MKQGRGQKEYNIHTRKRTRKRTQGRGEHKLGRGHILGHPGPSSLSLWLDLLDGSMTTLMWACCSLSNVSSPRLSVPTQPPYTALPTQVTLTLWLGPVISQMHFSCFLDRLRQIWTDLVIGWPSKLFFLTLTESENMLESFFPHSMFSLHWTPLKP